VLHNSQPVLNSYLAPHLAWLSDECVWSPRLGNALLDDGDVIIELMFCKLHYDAWMWLCSSFTMKVLVIDVAWCWLCWDWLMLPLFGRLGLACVGRDVDTSLFLRKVSNLETLNGQNRWEPGFEHCLCVLDILIL
jgi:hypothetical protein